MTVAFLVQLIVVLVILGVVLYLVENVIPMDPAIKTVIRVIVILAVCLWLLSILGLLPLHAASLQRIT